MKKKVELPLLDPIYSAYQSLGPATATIVNNPSIRNWYFNQVMNLFCTRKFLYGRTTPSINIVDSSWNTSPYLDKVWYDMQFLRGHIHYAIRNLLDAGYYVCFYGIDDYYVEGKSWFRERHFAHDGCICGYNQEDKTYCIYTYDKNWIYRKIWTTQKSFEEGRKASFKKGVFGYICGIKPKMEQIQFSAQTALRKIAEYLDSTMDKYPESTQGPVYGIVVQDYIAKYVGKLHEGFIPYEKMDRRIFRMIWEHKKAMLQRIKLIEVELSLDTEVSCGYATVVHEADNARMLYAAHHMKRRDSVLPTIQHKLLSLRTLEEELLKRLIEKAKGADKKLSFGPI